MKKLLLILLTLFIPISANAGEFYAEIGLGMRIGGYNETKNSEIGYSNPLGSIEIGYCGIVVKEICSSIQHVSSIPQKDRGINTLWLNYRKTW